MYPKKKKANPQNNANIEMKIAQTQYVVGELAKKLQGIIFGFDNYVKMNGDDKKLNNYIKEIIEARKKEVTKENIKDESTRDDSKSSNEKSVGVVSQDTTS